MSPIGSDLTSASQSEEVLKPRVGRGQRRARQGECLGEPWKLSGMVRTEESEQNPGDHSQEIGKCRGAGPGWRDRREEHTTQKEPTREGHTTQPEEVERASWRWWCSS